MQEELQSRSVLCLSSGSGGGTVRTALDFLSEKVAKRDDVCTVHDNACSNDVLVRDCAVSEQRSDLGSGVSKGQYPKISLPREIKRAVAKRFRDIVGVNCSRFLRLLRLSRHWS
jgi:hypothetical protein